LRRRLPSAAPDNWRNGACGSSATKSIRRNSSVEPPLRRRVSILPLHGQGELRTKFK
jgi:hypothetical protein